MFEQGCVWNVMTKLFQNKHSMFDKFIYSFLNLLSEWVLDEQVLPTGASSTLNDLLDYIKSFYTITYAWYATDVTLQQCLRPEGTLHENRLYFSEKHKFYG